MSPLTLLKEGETGEIVAHHEGLGHACRRHHGHHHAHGHGHDLCCGRCETCTCRETDYRTSDHLNTMGLRAGKKVEMITNNGTGPLVLRVDECRIAMGRGAAMKIYVRRIEK